MESILAQDYTDVEIIVIDDGSTDGSLTRAKKFESKQIRIYSKENGGPASARNFGISKCSHDSRYVMFVDSDDTIEPSYVSLMVKYASANSLVICGINDVYPNNIEYQALQQAHQHDEYNNIWQNIKFFELLKLGIINSSCNKCYSLDIIRNNDITFSSTYPEDTQFNVEYLELCEKVCVLRDKLYNYIHRNGSVTAKPFESLYTGYMEIQERLIEKVSEENRNQILEFVYPQYLGNTLKYIHTGDYETPKKYLKLKPIKEAIAAHKPTCLGDAIVKYLIKYRQFGLIKKI